MNIHLLWYNPICKEYQAGDRAQYKKVLNDSNEPENFILLEKFRNLTEKGQSKLFSQISALNNYKNDSQLLYK
ncbi:MAG: hypothetical protein RIG77_16645 [Cyclobacteriaceae bacterium]